MTGLKTVTQEYRDYHWQMYEIGDIDPSYDMLRYICQRFDLNLEQRYWLAFLYGMTYCGPSAYYVYNEFPDFELVDLSRMNRWWSERGKKATYFQTDRRWVRSRDQFVPAVESYKEHVGNVSQASWFGRFKTPDVYLTYDEVFKSASSVYQMGRFALFNWLEAVHVVTGFPMKPKSLTLQEAESCRNGLAYALGQNGFLTGKKEGRQRLSMGNMAILQNKFDELVLEMSTEADGRRLDVWNVETTLCAYKKYKHGQRYIGYYIDRQGKEITSMEKSVPFGVHWGVLWDFRKEVLHVG